MYGAYMYGKTNKDIDLNDVDTEKNSMHLLFEVK